MIDLLGFEWSERRDSNSRPPGPKNSYWAVKPPSTLNTEPWQRLESGEAKK